MSDGETSDATGRGNAEMSKGGKRKRTASASGMRRLMSGSPLPLVTAPDERLQRSTRQVAEVDDAVRDLAADMLATMYASGGCGLAAPQVGSDLRIFVMDVEWRDDGGKASRRPQVFVNPQIVVADGERVTDNEGCLSFPDLRVDVARPSHVVVEALDEEGCLVRVEADGDLASRCIQHETDHLDGVTMVDRLGPVAKARAMAEYRGMAGR